MEDKTTGARASRSRKEAIMRRRGFLRLVGGGTVLTTLAAGCLTTGKGRPMTLDRLAMPPFNTTLMGVVKGVLDYHGIEVDGGQLWILGLKTEGRARHIVARNGAKVELLGGVSYQSWDKQPTDPPMFTVTNSDASFTFGF
jgi:hypothetical protein